MAVEFTLQNGRWSARALRQFLEQWAPKSPLPLLTWAPWETSPHGMRCWLFVEGASRGVFLSRRISLVKGAPVTVRLNSMASRADWSLAYALLRSLLQGRGGRVEGYKGRVMRPEHLGDSEAVGDALVQQRVDAEAVADNLRRGERFAAFPNPEFSQVVTEAMLPDETESGRFAIGLEEMLRGMAARYQRASSAPLSQLPDGSGLSIWSMDEALVYWPGHIGVRQGADAEDGAVWAGPHLLNALGSRSEIVSEDQDRFYLPALDPGTPEDRSLIERLMKEGTPVREFMARFQRAGRGVV